MTEDRPDLSVVVPAYNEAGRLPPGVRRAHAFLRERGLRAEILLVDDGSRDGTGDVARALAAELPGVRALGYPANRGKGFAVRTGVAQATGHAVLFADADFSTPIEELDALRAALREGADVALGSRHLAQSRILVEQPRRRRHLGPAFNRVLGLLGIRGVADTQCGFKLFTRDAAARIFPRVKTDGFAFDVEVLLVARRLGLRIREVPVRWINHSDSRVRPLRDSLRMLRDVLRMRGLL
jgi:dolichyl-phosphate beta-glucosyltransferase